MRNARRGTPVRATEARLERALAYLMASTRRARRTLDLLTVAQELQLAREGLGGLKAVAEALQVSTEMVREFASVERLSAPVKQMIRGGLLGSVDVAYRLSQLPADEQAIVAREYAEKKLTLKEVRDVVSFRRKHPRLSLADVVARVRGSRDIRAYVIRLPLKGSEADLPGLLQRLARITGDSGILSKDQEDGIAVFTISEEGEKRLRDCAKKHGLSKRDLVERVVLRGRDLHV